jgi:hypothetical protein
VKVFARSLAFLLITCLLANVVFSADNGFSLGYGIGAFNQGRSGGKVEGGGSYNFLQGLYAHERPLSAKEWAFVTEPFGAYIIKPNPGFDLGLDIGLRYYPILGENGGFYLTAGPGISYTTIGFKEQGTHLLFILEGGVGYKYKNFYMENRMRHYSNGGTARPNWSVNANILSIGALF